MGWGECIGSRIGLGWVWLGWVLFGSNVFCTLPIPLFFFPLSCLLIFSGILAGVSQSNTE